jgi:hypothetical protein
MVRQRGLRTEALGESSGQCECCGNESRCVWGIVFDDDVATAAYWMHWTPRHLPEEGANLDLVVGRWGDDATSEDRMAIALLHRQQADGTPALMVIDAADRPSRDRLAGRALSREDVIGTPLAGRVFALADAIYANDDRIF